MEKSCPGKKKPAFTIPQRHIYFILKGRFEVTLQSFPSDIFQLDILWHFQLNIADIPAEELKACLKRDASIKAHSLFLYLPHRSLLPSPCLFITPFPSCSCSRAGLRAPLAKFGGVASHFNPRGWITKKFYRPEIHRRQTQSVWLEAAYDAAGAKIQRLGCGETQRSTNRIALTGGSMWKWIQTHLLLLNIGSCIRVIKAYK